MDEHRNSLRNLQSEKGKPDSESGRYAVAIDSGSAEEATRSHEHNDPMAKERSSVVERLVSQPLLLERGSGRGMNYGESPLLPLIKHFLYMKTLEEVNRKMWENQVWPWNRE